MKLERWFIGILVAWMLSIPWAYLFSYVFAKSLGSKQMAPPLVPAIIDYFGTSPLGPVALLLMFVGLCVTWFAPFIWAPMLIFFLFKYTLRLVKSLEKAK